MIALMISGAIAPVLRGMMLGDAARCAVSYCSKSSGDGGKYGVTISGGFRVSCNPFPAIPSLLLRGSILKKELRQKNNRAT
jgi:hypothetical protein